MGSTIPNSPPNSRQSSPPAEAHRNRFRHLRSPWHTLRRQFGDKVEVTLETQLGEEIFTRFFRRASDCLDLTHAAYKYDKKHLLAPRFPLGEDGGIAAFSRVVENGTLAYLKPGQTLRRVTVFRETKITLRVVSHAELTKLAFLEFVRDECFKSEISATRKNRKIVKLVPYEYAKKQPMDIWTHWNNKGHCIGYMRPSCEDSRLRPLCERPGGVQRRWARFEVMPTQGYPKIVVSAVILSRSEDFHHKESMFFTQHQSLSFQDIAEAAVPASKGRYKVYHKNCQTTLLDIYESEKVGLADYASQFDNMLRRTGIQTRETVDDCAREHHTLEPYPDKGALEYCGREAFVVCCG